MSLPRHRPRTAFGRCGMAAGLLGLLPSGIGHQDLAALAAQRPIVAAPAHSHIIASPFGTIEKATFSLPAPISEAMPPSLAFVLAGLDPGNAAARAELDQAGSRGGSTIALPPPLWRPSS